MYDLDLRCQNCGGRSGAFFYYTKDGQYLLKTITSEEVSVLDSIIDEYTQRVTDKTPSTFARILGLYQIKVDIARSIYVILMENLSYHMDNPWKFDMKGSAIDRRVTFSSYNSIDNLSKDKVYKDIDFDKAIGSLGIQNSQMSEIIASIRLDTKLLKRHLIMDYSLFLMVTSGKSVKSTMVKQKNYVESGRYVIGVGIIDFLQAYNTRKKLENRYKTLKQNEGEAISAIPPRPYRKRFLAMMKAIFYPLSVN